MEAFSLLKYWRGGGGASLPSPSPPPPPPLVFPAGASHNTTTIVASAFPDDTDDDGCGAGGDDGPFFDLEFAVGEVSDNGDDEEEQRKGDGDSDSDSDCDVGGDGEGEGEGEFDFTLSSASSCNDPADPTNQLALSPSDEMLFKGTLVPTMESPSYDDDALMNPKSQRIPASLFKSAAKFQVFLLGFKKSKEKSPGKQKPTDSAADGVTEEEEEVEEKENGKQGGKLFTVKFKVEEVPIVSLFTRDNSSKSGGSKSSQKQQQNDNGTDNAAGSSAAEERQRFSKEALQKYLKKVKPLYVRVSKRYGEKLGFSGQLSLGTNFAKPTTTTAEEAVGLPPAPTVLKASPSEKVQQNCQSQQQETMNVVKVGVVAKEGNLQAGIRVMCKHLGKSRSASSSAVASAPSPTASNRRDDSLLQQQDGIRSAILHCKKSFNASRGEEEESRSGSDSCSPAEKSGEWSSRKDCGDDGKASSGSVVVV